MLAPAFQQELSTLRQEKFIRFEEAKLHKLTALQLCYQHFREQHLTLDTERAVSFRLFQRKQGKALRQYALYRALREKLEPLTATAKSHGWRHWPEGYKNIDADGTKEFAASNLERIEYFEYLQWNADLQLAAVRELCAEASHPMVLLNQLPKLIDPAGTDALAGARGKRRSLCQSKRRTRRKTAW